MAKKGEAPEATPGHQTGRDTVTNNLRFYNSRKSEILQAAAVYPPGWLIARMKQPPPANPISRAQGLALLNLIRVMGLETYRGYKTRLGIPTDTPIHRLSKQQAWQLINAIVTDLEAAE